MSTKGEVVIASYQPKPGKQAELLAILEDHVPTLRMLGLVSGFPRSIMTAKNGTVVEIFEWESDEAAKAAHDHPEVKKIWDSIALVADFVPLSGLEEFNKPFAHLKQVKNDRTERVVHFEIETDDQARIAQFYGDVFGWTFHAFNEDYWMLDTGREPCPGIDGAVMKRKQPQTAITNIVRVKNLDESLKKLTKAGGEICKPKFTVPQVGYIAYALDPDQNVIGLMQMDMDAK